MGRRDMQGMRVVADVDGGSADELAGGADGGVVHVGEELRALLWTASGEDAGNGEESCCRCRFTKEYRKSCDHGVSPELEQFVLLSDAGNGQMLRRSTTA